MDIAFLIGRIIVGLFWLFSGFHHFTSVNMMAGYAASKGVPAPKAGILFSGVLAIIGGLSIGFGYYPLVGVIAICVFLIPVSIMIHNYWAVQDPMQKMNDMANFHKNVALLGATLMFLAIPQPWPYSV